MATRDTTAVADPNLTFSAEELQEVNRIIAKFPEGKQKSALLGILQMARSKWGWVSVPVMDYIAGLLSINPIEVYEVATFYTMFHLDKTGRHVLEVCRTSPCCLVGAEETIEKIEQTLGIKVGETTADGMFTLKVVECLAACGFGPVVQVDEKYHEHITADKVDGFLAELRAQ